MVSVSQAVSMTKELWQEVEKYRTQYNFTTDSSVIQLAVKKLVKKERDYRFIDVVIVCILFVIVLLLMGVVLW